MTLKEIAELAASKVGKLSPNGIEKAKTFCKSRYEVIFNMAFWDDTRILVPLDTNGGIVILPRGIDRVIAIKKGNYDYIPSKGIPEVIQYNPAMYEPNETFSGYTIMPDSFVATQPNGQRINCESNSADDNGKQILIQGVTNDIEIEEIITLKNDTQTLSVNQYDSITKLTKEITSGTVTIVSENDQNTVIQRLMPYDTDRRQTVLRIHGTYSTAQSLIIYGKSRFKNLNHDLDAPQIGKIDNILQTFVLADLLEWRRQYNKSASKFAEAEKLLNTLITAESVQEDRSSRIDIVEDNYSYNWDSDDSF